ncbi:MAG TPA: VIT domain-containing protein [Abditibacteriaceae bacterium]|jgi:hypothetical protein
MKRWLVVWTLLFCVLPANARILLKPKGGGAMPLRLKALDASVEIERQFATTVTQMTFQNEVQDRIEADFIYTVPPNSVVTYFAYWYEEEKVVARVVEKERAASIYQHITSRMRDPALIELVGKDTFRARIFPIMPNADLRVEIHTVETLPSTSEGARYTFALAPEEKGTGTLENLDVRVRIKRDAALLGAGNNFALPINSETGAWTMHLAQKNFRPTQDLRVGLKFKPQTLHARLLAAPSGGNDGFFALALTAPRNIAKPRLQISGVKTYDILPRRLPNLKGGQQITVVGRYRGSGAARVSLGNLQSTVEFDRTARNNNPATKLWAAQQIAALSGNAKNRARVVALSQRFTLPSKWTSWLAIPEAERQRYKVEKAYAELATATHRYVAEKENGRAKGATARKLLESVRENAKLTGQSEEEALRQATNSRIYALASAHVREKYAARPSRKRMADYKRRVTRLASSPAAANAELKQVEQMVFDNARGVLYDYVAQKAAPRNSPHYDPSSLKYAQEAVEGLNLPRARKARLLKEAQQRFDTAQRLLKVSEKLADNIYNGQDTTPETQQLDKEFGSLVKQAPRGYLDRSTYLEHWEVERRPREAYLGRAHVTAHEIVTEEKSATPDDQKLARLNSELKRAAAKVGVNPKHFLNQHRTGWSQSQTLKQVREIYGRNYYLRQGDPLISIDAPADALQVVAILPNGEIKQLVYDAVRKRWEARFDVPTYATEGDYKIEIVIVDAAGARRRFFLTYQVDMSSPRGEALAQRNDGKWRLEVKTEGDVARVAAILPSGEKIELKPSATDASRYLAFADAPEEGASSRVTYILTDRAHNRTEISVDMAK